MTIDDGICENCLSKNNCDVLPYSNNCNEVRAMLKHDKEVYNKAIDDLLEYANEMAIEVDTGTYTMKAIGIGLLEHIAEQLKGDENNGTDSQ